MWGKTKTIMCSPQSNQSGATESDLQLQAWLHEETAVMKLIRAFPVSQVTPGQQLQDWQQWIRGWGRAKLEPRGRAKLEPRGRLRLCQLHRQSHWRNHFGFLLRVSEPPVFFSSTEAMRRSVIHGLHTCALTTCYRRRLS